MKEIGGAAGSIAPYSRLAQHYDLLGWADFTGRLWPHLEHLFESNGSLPPRFLDIACGTGVLAAMMSKRGVRVTGIDACPEMIGVARSKEYTIKPRFSVADMRDFDLGCEFPMTGCFYDSLNHLLSEDDLRRAFECAYRHTEEGGRYLFDMNTTLGFQNWKPFYSLQRGRFYVSQRGDFDRKARTGRYRIEAFVRGPDGEVEFVSETVTEKAYSRRFIQKTLADAGFRRFVFAPFVSGESVALSERLLVVCSK